MANTSWLRDFSAARIMATDESFQALRSACQRIDDEGQFQRPAFAPSEAGAVQNGS